MNFFQNHSGLSFVELLVSITIMAIVGGIALVSFGNFFESQEKNRVQSGLESTIGQLDREVQNGKISDYELTLSGGNIGYIVEKNNHKKPADLLIGFTYDFDANSGTLTRTTNIEPWTIDLYSENKLKKTFLTNDLSQKISLPDTTTKQESYTIKSRIDGQNTNYFVIQFFSPRDKDVSGLVRLTGTNTASPILLSNILGKVTFPPMTLSFEQASKQFDITLTK